MTLSSRAFIAGGAHTSFIGKGHPDFIWKRHPDFGIKENPTWESLLQDAVDGVLERTGVNPEDIDRLYLGNFTGELFVNQGHMGAALVGCHPAFANKPSMRVEGACASGGLAIMSGLDAIAAGADFVLVAGVEVQTTVSARDGGDYLARASHYSRQRGIDDFTFPALFGRRAKAYCEAFGVTAEDIDSVSIKAYHNANKNPLAHMKAAKMDAETAASSYKFLTNEKYKPYVKVSDCSQVSDGASAMLLVSEAGLAKLGKTEAEVAEIVGRGHSVASLYEDGDLTQLNTSANAVSKAYSQAGVSAKDIDIAEVHDCFAVTECMMYEAAGFAGPGEGAKLAASGETSITGSIPVNTGGGLIGFGHPVGATGVKQAVEIFRQMKQDCGGYQVDKYLNYGLTINMGGDDKTVVSLVIRNGSLK
jgi:acetyl-CoA acyltransferase